MSSPNLLASIPSHHLLQSFLRYRQRSLLSIQKYHSASEVTMSLPPGVDLSQIPSLRPPPGVIPNFKHPPSLADALIAVDVVFLALMLVAVGVRVYTKGFILRSLGWDDCEWLNL